MIICTCCFLVQIPEESVAAFPMINTYAVRLFCSVVLPLRVDRSGIDPLPLQTPCTLQGAIMSPSTRNTADSNLSIALSQRELINLTWQLDSAPVQCRVRIIVLVLGTVVRSVNQNSTRWSLRNFMHLFVDDHLELIGVWMLYFCVH